MAVLLSAVESAFTAADFVAADLLRLAVGLFACAVVSGFVD